MGARILIVSALLVALVTVLYEPAIRRTVTVLGALREPINTIVDSSNIVLIEDTVHCEDLHHHLPSNQLYTACEDHETLRFSWFPPLARFDASPVERSQGSIHVIDAQTLKSQRLKFENFDGPFVTHGIDVITDPKNVRAVYIYAVNHLPNPEYPRQLEERKQLGFGPTTELAKARSQLEVFHHIKGSDTVKHIRSIRHLLIQTPNDVLALSPTSLLVTNDHHYRDGPMRMVEDVFSNAEWSTIVHVKIANLSITACDEAESGITATIANTKLHNNNGLGRGRSDDEIVIDSAASGVVHIGKLSGTKDSCPSIQIIGDVELDCVADNPSYFSDPYATSDNDASGFVVTGMSKAVDLAHTSRDPAGKDPSKTWFVKPGPGPVSTWEKKLLFEDDSSRIRSSSSAVLVGIDPKIEGGIKKAWLFVTGIFSSNIIALKIDL